MRNKNSRVGSEGSAGGPTGAGRRGRQRQRHVPLRTCLVCRRKLDKRQLTRIVRTPESVVVDPSGKRNGRGAYLCEQQDCWEQAVANPGIINQALKTTISEEDLASIAAQRPPVLEE